MTTLMDKRTERRFRDWELFDPDSRAYALRTTICPDCRDKDDAYECYTCFGLRRIALAEKKRPLKIRWSAVALWGAILAFTGLVYGFLWAWLGPLIHRLLAKLELW